MKIHCRFLVAPLAAVLASSLAGCGGDVQTAVPEQSRSVPVRAARVESRDLDRTVLLTGTLRPRSQVQVVAEVRARLLRILKDEVARVSKDETLAILDATDYRLAHDRARAALAVAEANRAHAEVEKERSANLVKTGGITDKDRLAAEVNLQVAAASLAQARADSAIAAEQQARAEVRSPLTGRIARRVADPGSLLAAGSPIFTVVDDAVLEFRASIPSADYARIRLGAPAEVTVDALGGLAVQGKVVRVTPLVEERTRSFEVVVQVPGQSQLVGGMFGRARVGVEKVAGALVVPPAALLREGTRPGQAQVFVVAGGKADRHEVALGIEGSDAVQVRSGVEAGDLVVLDPPAALSSGSPVTIVNGRAQK
jgi:RND family efflux transporter MFP subunit